MGERIAITVAVLTDLSAVMDPRFGRAAGFLVVQDGEIATISKNTAVLASHGAGTGAASMMQQLGVAKVISGAFGPKAFAALAEMGIEMLLAPPGLTAAQALERADRGELPAQSLRVMR